MPQSLQIARHSWGEQCRRWSGTGIDAKIAVTEFVAGSASTLAFKIYDGNFPTHA
jgi:hypothetical protein